MRPCQNIKYRNFRLSTSWHHDIYIEFPPSKQNHEGNSFAASQIAFTISLQMLNQFAPEHSPELFGVLKVLAFYSMAGAKEDERNKCLHKVIDKYYRSIHPEKPIMLSRSRVCCIHRPASIVVTLDNIETSSLAVALCSLCTRYHEQVYKQFLGCKIMAPFAPTP